MYGKGLKIQGEGKWAERPAYTYTWIDNNLYSYFDNDTFTFDKKKKHEIDEWRWDDLE